LISSFAKSNCQRSGVIMGNSDPNRGQLGGADRAATQPDLPTPWSFRHRMPARALVQSCPGFGDSDVREHLPISARILRLAVPDQHFGHDNRPQLTRADIEGLSREDPAGLVRAYRDGEIQDVLSGAGR
jgi:hypothetical protein